MTTTPETTPTSESGTQLRHRLRSRIHQLMHWAPQKKTITTTALTASSAILLLAGSAIATSHIEVTLDIDGVSRPFTTFATNIDNVLANAGIDIKTHDAVAPARNSTATNGMTIVVRHARTINVNINGTPTTITTTAHSLHDALAQLSTNGSVQAAANRYEERGQLLPLLTHPQDVTVHRGGHTHTIHLHPGQDIRTRLTEENIPLAPLDRVHARIENGQFTIVIEPVTRGNTTTTRPIAFSERTQESDEYFIGESVVTTPGVPGTTTINLWQETINGTITHSTALGEKTTTPPQEQIRTNGTKEVTPLELVKAGIDPRAQLEDVHEPNGSISKRYRAPLGTLSSDEEITALRVQAQLAGIPLVYNGEDPRNIARPLVANYGWGDDQFRCLVALWDRESHWNPYAENSSSGAYGIPQALPGSKMSSAGADWQTNPATQITWGLGYISGRYGSPCAAWGHSESVGWY